jgi:hypothetical protein
MYYCVCEFLSRRHIPTVGVHRKCPTHRIMLTYAVEHRIQTSWKPIGSKGQGRAMTLDEWLDGVKGRIHRVESRSIVPSAWFEFVDS